jgi:hypothetical protein
MKKSYRRWDKVEFHRLGVGGSKGRVEQLRRTAEDPNTPTDWRIESFDDIKRLLGHTNVSNN